MAVEDCSSPGDTVYVKLLPLPSLSKLMIVALSWVWTGGESSFWREMHFSVLPHRLSSQEAWFGSALMSLHVDQCWPSAAGVQ